MSQSRQAPFGGHLDSGTVPCLEGTERGLAVLHEASEGVAAMLKACLIGAAVTLALIAVPVVHFITGLPSAFIGGYLAGSRAAATPGKAILIGSVMASVLVAPVGGVLFLMSLLYNFRFGASWVLIFIGFFAFWILLLGSLGAVIGGTSVRNQAVVKS